MSDVDYLTLGVAITAVAFLVWIVQKIEKEIVFKEEENA